MHLLSLWPAAVSVTTIGLLALALCACSHLAIGIHTRTWPIVC
jgi:hypothetical protein